MIKKTLILIVLIAGTMFPLEGIKAQEMKVISFNIRYNGAAKEDGIYAWPNRVKSVLKMIETEHPVAMGLQEALLDQLSSIDRKFVSRYRRVGVGRDNGLTRGEHTAIYYDYNKLELLSYKTRWLSEHPLRVSKGWDAACMRTVTIAKFKVKSTGKVFYYFNTHLDHVGKVARRESIKLIANLIKNETEPNAAVILGGDMNSEIDFPLFEPLTEQGMEVAREIATRTDYKNSYNAYGKTNGAMIDHFLVKNLMVKKLETLTKNYGIKYISDHYPVMMIINL